MFKQVKSALIWYHLYKFRKTVISVVILLAIVLFMQWIYSDVVEYLKLREKLELLDVILPLKWAIIFFNIGLSVLLVLRLFKTKEQEEQKEEPIKQIKEEKKITREENSEAISEQLSEREKSFLHTKKLNSKADELINR